MIGKSRGNRFISSFRDVFILRHGCADIFQHNHSLVSGITRQVGIFYLSITQIDFLSSLHSFERDFRHSHHILPHVVHKDARTNLFYRLCRQLLNSLYRLTVLSHQMEIGIIIDFRHCSPT